MVTTRRLVLGAGLGTLAVGREAFGSAAWSQIVIATVGPMTGQYASFGEQMKNGAEMAVADINAAGGVLGKKLVLASRRRCLRPEAGGRGRQPDGRRRRGARRRAFLLGLLDPGLEGLCRGATSCRSRRPRPTRRFTDERAGRTSSASAAATTSRAASPANISPTTSPTRTSPFVDDKTAYGKGLADETKKAMNAAGKQEAMYEAITAGEKDYSALVSKLKQANIDVVYFGGYHTEAGLIMRQMRDQGMDTILMGGDALVTQEFWSITGAAGEGTLMTFSPRPAQEPGGGRSGEALQGRRSSPRATCSTPMPRSRSSQQAAEKANTTDPRRLAAVLKAEGPWQTVLGPISFTPKGDVTVPDYVFYVWRNGAYAEIS